MKRREFCAGLGAAAGLVAVPGGLEASGPRFVSPSELCEGYYISVPLGAHSVSQIVAEFESQVALNLTLPRSALWPRHRSPVSGYFPKGVPVTTVPPPALACRLQPGQAIVPVGMELRKLKELGIALGSLKFHGGRFEPSSPDLHDWLTDMTWAMLWSTESPMMHEGAPAFSQVRMVFSFILV